MLWFISMDIIESKMIIIHYYIVVTMCFSTNSYAIRNLITTTTVIMNQLQPPLIIGKARVTETRPGAKIIDPRPLEAPIAVVDVAIAAVLVRRRRRRWLRMRRWRRRRSEDVEVRVWEGRVSLPRRRRTRSAGGSGIGIKVGSWEGGGIGREDRVLREGRAKWEVRN